LNVKVKVTRDKNVLSAAVTLGIIQVACARCKHHAAAVDDTIASLPEEISGGLRAEYVWSNIFSSSLNSFAAP